LSKSRHGLVKDAKMGISSTQREPSLRFWTKWRRQFTALVRRTPEFLRRY
jgi:hypothetical protein